VSVVDEAFQSVRTWQVSHCLYNKVLSTDLPMRLLHTTTVSRFLLLSKLILLSSSLLTSFKQLLLVRNVQACHCSTLSRSLGQTLGIGLRSLGLKGGICLTRLCIAHLSRDSTLEPSLFLTNYVFRIVVASGRCVTTLCYGA
jgi:hypothetical protein